MQLRQQTLVNLAVDWYGTEAVMRPCLDDGVEIIPGTVGASSVSVAKQFVIRKRVTLKHRNVYL